MNVGTNWTEDEPLMNPKNEIALKKWWLIFIHHLEFPVLSTDCGQEKRPWKKSVLWWKMPHCAYNNIMAIIMLEKKLLQSLLKALTVLEKEKSFFSALQGWKGVGWRPSRLGLVGCTFQPLKAGRRTSAHQKLEATDPRFGQSGLKVEREAQTTFLSGLATQSRKRLVMFFFLSRIKHHYSLWIFSGLTIAFTCLNGEFSSMFAESQAARNSIRQALRDEGVKGFAEVVVSNNTTDGICHV